VWPVRSGNLLFSYLGYLIIKTRGYRGIYPPVRDKNVF